MCILLQSELHSYDFWFRFNRFFPRICNAIRPLLPPLSVFVTALCVGAPLAINIESLVSPSGMSVLLLMIAFHLSAFILGYLLSGIAFHKAPDVKPLQRTLSYETGLKAYLILSTFTYWILIYVVILRLVCRHAEQPSCPCSCK